MFSLVQPVRFDPATIRNSSDQPSEIGVVPFGHTNLGGRRMNLAKRTDEELMQAFQSGNSDAFDTLFNRYYTPLQRYLESRIRQDTDNADDVCQAVFMRVHKHAGGFQTGQLFRPWLYAMADRLAKNANRDYHRRKKHTMRFSDFDKESDHAGDVAWSFNQEGINFTEIIGDGPINEAEVSHQRDIREALPKIVLSLPVHLRQIVQFVLTNGASLRRAEAVLCVGRRTLSKRLDEACAIIRSRCNHGEMPEGSATLSDVELATVRDLIDLLPPDQCDALSRVVLEDSEHAADLSSFCAMLNKLIGNVSTEVALV